jgi:hypothetical protein
MPEIQIDDLEIDDDNEAEMLRHGVYGEEVFEMFYEVAGWKLLTNGGEGNAPYKLVGRTLGGRWITVPIDRTPVLGLWRPATAMDSDKDELSKVKK